MSSKKCRVPYCTSARSSDVRVSKHSFPNDVNLRQQWVQAVFDAYKEGMKTFEIGEHDVICSQHFDKNCFVTEKKKRFLKKGSVPTLFKQPSCYEPVKLRKRLNVTDRISPESLHNEAQERTPEKERGPE